jgi:hypothetical protein
MKKTILTLALLAAVSSAHAGDYQHYSALLGICKMQAKIAMTLAHAKITGEPPLTKVEDYRDGNPGLYELVVNMDRIAEEYKDLGLQMVGERAGMWCMDNAENIVFKYR